MGKGSIFVKPRFDGTNPVARCHMVSKQAFLPTDQVDIGGTEMTGIAISNRRMSGVLGRTVAAALLVAAGAVAGIEVARIGGLASPAAQTTAVTAGQLAGDQAWQAFRAGERGAGGSGQ